RPRPGRRGRSPAERPGGPRRPLLRADGRPRREHRRAGHLHGHRRDARRRGQRRDPRGRSRHHARLRPAVPATTGRGRGPPGPRITTGGDRGPTGGGGAGQREATQMAATTTASGPDPALRTVAVQPEPDPGSPPGSSGAETATSIRSSAGPPLAAASGSGRTPPPNTTLPAGQRACPEADCRAGTASLAVTIS